MEQKQITLEKIYTLMRSMQQELHNISDKLDWENEFTEEENLEFEERTKQAQKEIDEGKGITTTEEEFLSGLRSLKENA